MAEEESEARWERIEQMLQHIGMQRAESRALVALLLARMNILDDKTGGADPSAAS